MSDSQGKGNKTVIVTRCVHEMEDMDSCPKKDLQQRGEPVVVLLGDLRPALLNEKLDNITVAEKTLNEEDGNKTKVVPGRKTYT